MDKIKATIIDEQAIFRTGVRQALSRQSDLEVLECDPTQNAMETIEANLPDVVLLGSDLPASVALSWAGRFPNTIRIRK